MRQTYPPSPAGLHCDRKCAARENVQRVFVAVAVRITKES